MKKNLLVLQIALLIIYSSLVFLIYGEFFRNYYPTGDDYSLIGAATFWKPSDWFFKGFSDYFIIYPDITRPYTNFIRPVINMIFYLENKFFGEIWWLYFIPGITFNLIIGSYILFFTKAKNIFHLVLLLLILITSPIFSLTLGSPPFAFDSLAAVFCLFALFALKKDNDLLTILFCFLAVYTKEIGLVFTTALIFYKVLNKNINLSLGLSIVIFSWLVIRFLGVGFGGCYATNDLSLLLSLKKFLISSATWPIGGYFNYRENLILTLFSGALNCCLIYIYWKNFKSKLNLSEIKLNPEYIIQLFLVSYLILLGLGCRFGVIFMSIQLIFIFNDFFLYKRLALLLIATVSIMQFSFPSKDFKPFENARNLVQTIKQIPHGRFIVLNKRTRHLFPTEIFGFLFWFSRQNKISF